MSRSFLAVFVLIILIAACNQPVNVTTLPSEPTFTQPMPSATTTALVEIGVSHPTETATPLVVPPTAALCAAPVPRVAIGDKVMVTVENWDKLKLRSKPEVSDATVVRELDQYSQLQILDGPLCVYSAETGYSYYFWKVVVILSGETGWVAEGDYTHYFLKKY